MSEEDPSQSKVVIRKLRSLADKAKSLQKELGSHKKPRHVQFNQEVKTKYFQKEDGPSEQMSKRTWNDGRSRKDKLVRG